MGINENALQELISKHLAERFHRDAGDLLSLATEILSENEKDSVQEKGPWSVRVVEDKRSDVPAAHRRVADVLVESDDFTHDVSLRVLGDFGETADKARYAREIARRLNAYMANNAANNAANSKEARAEMTLLARVGDTQTLSDAREVWASIRRGAQPVSELGVGRGLVISEQMVMLMDAVLEDPAADTVPESLGPDAVSTLIGGAGSKDAGERS